MKNAVKKVGVIFLILSFVFTPISFQLDNLSLNKETSASELEDINIGDIKDDIVIDEDENFVVEAGGEMIFTQDYITVDVYGKLEIKGTKNNPVKIKTTKNNFAIITHPGAELIMENVEIEKGGYQSFLMNNFFNSAVAANYMGAVHFEGGNVDIKGTTFKDCSNAVTSKKGVTGELKVNYSKFLNNEYDVEDENGADFTNNYWDDLNSGETCLNNKNVISCLPNSWGNFKIYPWQTDPNFSYEEGASSVLFLPGIESSRLYKEHLLDEDMLWEPTNRNEDVKDLYLNADGTSIDNEIYTKDLLDEFHQTVNIYKGFMSYMDRLVTDETIEAWKAVPYDWRLPLESSVDGKIKLKDDKEISIIDELETLARESNTGKVTIIGHSNGGLLGKLIISKLKSEGKENLVDKFIMVATPQVGTPKAIMGLLHGTDLSFPFFLNEQTGRGLAENMSSAYNLLPSKKYFEYAETPVVEFEDDVKDIYDFKELYGDKIDNKEELDKFLTGDEGKRSDPNSDDTDSPNVLSAGLLSKANSLHDSSLDNWNAPENIEVIQIAGWGLDTIAGIKYDDCDIVFCSDELSNLDRELIFKKDGDATVVVPSAIIMNDGEIYYVNIEKYNDGPTRNREHASILEISNLQEFIKNILNNNRDLPSYITTIKPAVSDEDESLRYRMHSPVAVHLYDEENNHTGLTDNPNPESDLVYYEENIPNSYYLEFGETKYLGSPKDGVTRVELIGEDTGTFTFEIDEIEGDSVDKTTVFKDVPVIKDMRADIDISDNIGIMNIDWNNDKKVDIIINTEKSNSAPKASLEILKEIIKSSKINPILKNIFLNELNVAQKQIAKGNNKVVGKILEILEKQIEAFSDKNTLKKLRINKTEAENLIKIIETIRLNLIK